MPHWQTTEDRATQLLYSIQFKLSHAILGLQMDADEQEDNLCDFVRETQKHILQAVFGRSFD